MERRTIALVLLILGLLGVVLGASGIGLDLGGLGDRSGIDPIDLATLLLGVLLAGVGGYLLSRRAGG